MVRGEAKRAKKKDEKGENYKELAAWAIDGRLLSSCPTAAVSQEMKDAPVLCRLPNNTKQI